MMLSRRFLLAVPAVVLAAFGLSPSAEAYSGVYVFGDSLSDIGQVYSLTGGLFPAQPLYANGRFSNGPVAVETLTLALTGSPLTLANDYATGGARTGVSPFPNTAPTPTNPSPVLSDNNSDALNGTGLLRQTLSFQSTLGAGRADPNALYVVWAGANDFSQQQVLGNAGGTQWSRVIGNIETAIGNLAADGATHFLVPNVPNLGLTPRALASGASAAATASFLSGQFDVALGSSLSGYASSHSGIDITPFDVYGLLTTIVTNVRAQGSYLGITDVTSECQLGCADPGSSLFWDDEHPTAAAHALLGNAFVAALVPEPQTDALLLAGLAALGWTVRRRRGPTPAPEPGGEPSARS